MILVVPVGTSLAGATLQLDGYLTFKQLTAPANLALDKSVLKLDTC
jgi:hypothetical protein